jgi:hypothetical protein
MSGLVARQGGRRWISGSVVAKNGKFKIWVKPEEWQMVQDPVQIPTGHCHVHGPATSPQRA